MDGDFIRIDAPEGGVQRLVAGFHGHAYDPHRHETYAIGVTRAGAQGFRYRGTGRVSHAGQIMVLHPDEMHDGRSEAAEGFVYHMVYIEPALVAAAGGIGGPLPFVPDAVLRDAAITTLLAELYESFPAPLEPLERDAFVARLAELLRARSDSHAPERARDPIAGTRLARVMAFIRECHADPIVSEDLERVAGIDRFEIARQFRRVNGTSPHRYLIGRRLEAARARILDGEPLAAVASRTGFADQSHMTRHFKARFGMTPGRFAALAASDGR